MLNRTEVQIDDRGPDGRGPEELCPDECARLVASKTLGRVGLIVDGLPAVFPVNYVVRDDEIIVRTRRGSVIAAATRNNVVAFEVDDFDPDTGAGWCVMIQGVAREVVDVGHVRDAQNADLAYWLDGRSSRHFSVSMDLVSGRVVGPPQRPTRHHTPVQSMASSGSVMPRPER